MDDRPLSELGQAALDYVNMGFAVIPLIERDKRPATAHGLNDWTDNPEDVREWWSKYPNSNIGIVCGQPSHGLLVIDIDIDEEKERDGYATLREWEHINGALPETAVSITGKGGMHYLYRIDDSRPAIRPSANIELGIDIRCDASYIVAPPSVHPNGNRYEWQDSPEDTPVADADGNVYALVDHVQRTGEVNDLDMKKANGKFKLPKSIAEGKRDETLYKYGCHLRAIGRTAEEISNAIYGANAKLCHPPLSDRDLNKIVRSVCTKNAGKSAAYQDQENDQVSDSTAVVTERSELKTIQSIADFIEQKIGDSIGTSMPSRRPYVRGQLPWDQSGIVRPWSDYDFASLLAALEPMGVSEKKLTQAITIAMRHSEFWPVRDMLDFLPEWDGVTRPIDPFHKLLGVDPSIEYNVVLGDCKAQAGSFFLIILFNV